MISRIDQQILVNKLMIDFYVAHRQILAGNHKMGKYMFNYLEIITTVSSVLLIRSGTEENLEKKKSFGDISKAVINYFISGCATVLWETP